MYVVEQDGRETKQTEKGMEGGHEGQLSLPPDFDCITVHVECGDVFLSDPADLRRRAAVREGNAGGNDTRATCEFSHTFPHLEEITDGLIHRGLKKNVLHLQRCSGKTIAMT